MSERTRTPDDGERSSAERPDGLPSSSSTIPERNAPELRLAVVAYDGSPNRGTIRPQGLAGIDRMETWLSANLAAFVDLSAWR